MTLSLSDRIPTGKHAGELLADVLISDPDWVLGVIAYGYRGFTDDVWDGMDLLGIL